jgi:DNA invertase Pin-like site-specific DNA recombinase
MRVIGYIRVSTEEQASHGVSLAAQEAKLHQYADLYELELAEVFVDAGMSAKSLHRPGIQQALAALESGSAEGILIAKLDRLCRSVGDWGTLIERYFGKKYALLSVADQIDTRSASGRLGLNILMSVNQWEREAIAERTSAALQDKKSQGLKLGAPSLQDRSAIDRMVELRKGGATYAAIASALTDEGYQTLRGGKWDGATVRKVLLREGVR